MPKTILEVTDLKKHFTYGKGLFSSFKDQQPFIPAVDGVSFYLKENETMGLVGESGCGKTTIGRTVLRLEKPTSGQIIFDGKDITRVPTDELRQLRSQMQMIFQDLDAALNPKMRIRDILSEAITVHHPMSGAEVEKRISELLEQVNLKKSKLSNFPHELSGGEKRRVGVARVLSVGARLIVADEPTSALDVSIQAQVVNLLRDLQTRLGLSYLFISHDLRVVELVSHKVAVMYLGKIVEIGLSDRIASRASHPYTHILWSSLAEKQSREAAPRSKSGQAGQWGVFDFERPAAGCRFAPRCPVYESNGKPEICTAPSSEPQLKDIGEAHQVACHFPL
ncbi:MAG TPA: ABC transporter ATP-binding protein [Thermodesulfobacteriota bacterium]|nr:ABC transporter ATP-binding protein [Thermodesulfobacteriota bacterium]